MPPKAPARDAAEKNRATLYVLSSLLYHIERAPSATPKNVLITKNPTLFTKIPCRVVTIPQTIVTAGNHILADEEQGETGKIFIAGHMQIGGQAIQTGVGDVAAIQEGNEVQERDTGEQSPIEFAQQGLFVDMSEVGRGDGRGRFSPTYPHSTYLNRFGPQCPSSHRTRGEVHSRSNTSWLVAVKMHQWAWSLVGKFIACAGGSSCIFEARDVVIPRVCRSHHGNFTLCTARGPEYTERNPQHKHTCMASGNRKWQDEAEVDEKEKGRRLLLLCNLLYCSEYHSLPPPRVQNFEDSPLNCKPVNLSSSSTALSALPSSTLTVLMPTCLAVLKFVPISSKKTISPAATPSLSPLSLANLFNASIV
ncbi:hypothetical protein KCV06_g206, partial [Aureobasidium melanogenum]